MKKRCFLSIQIPESAIPSFETLIQKIKDKNPSRSISYVKPRQIHVTLHFLGYRTEKEIQDIVGLTERVSKNFKQFHIFCKGFSGFPNMKSPRVLFLDGEVFGEDIFGLHGELKKGLESLGIETDSRPWVCHFTLARVKGRVALNFNDISFQKIDILARALYLMESKLSRMGPAYSVIQKFPLCSIF